MSEQCPKCGRMSLDHGRCVWKDCLHWEPPKDEIASLQAQLSERDAALAETRLALEDLHNVAHGEQGAIAKPDYVAWVRGVHERVHAVLASPAGTLPLAVLRAADAFERTPCNDTMQALYATVKAWRER